MRAFLIIFFAFILVGISAYAQKDSTDFQSIYKVRHKLEIPVTVLGLASIPLIYGQTDDLASLSKQEALALSRNDVNPFDRPVLDFSESGYERAHNISDQLMNISVLSAGLLMLHRDMRRDWLDVLTLYGQAHMFSTFIHQAGVATVRRARPHVYNTDLPIEKRSGANTDNSFFSGHTSTTAVSSFFIAKVIDDYNNLNRWQKAGLYTAAAVPPALVGYYRTKAGKHFRTDVLTGMAVGAAAGILVPHFHKRKDRKIAFYPGAAGLYCSLRF